MEESKRLSTQEELDEVVHLLKKLEREADDLNTRIENLKNMLKDEMTARGVSDMKGEDWTLSWNTVTSNRLDQSLLKLCHPEIFESCKVLTESRRFVLK